MTTTTRSLCAAAAAPASRSKAGTALRQRRHFLSTSTTSPLSPTIPSTSTTTSSFSSSSTTTVVRATWKDYIPRIVDNIPRRIPPGARDALEQAGASGPSTAASSSPDAPGHLPFAVDVGGAVDALRRLVFPESLAAPADLTLPVVVFGALAVGLALELATLALKAIEGAGGGGGGGEGGGGGRSSDAASSSSSASAAPPPPPSPPIDAPIVPRSPSTTATTKPSPTPPTTPTRAQIERERERLRDRIVAERYRGLTWLAAATAAALFTAGLMSAPTALRP